MVQVGDWYIDVTNGRLYVVAQIGGKFTLLNIHMGTSYCGLQENITDVFLGDARDFRKVSKHAN